MGLTWGLALDLSLGLDLELGLARVGFEHEDGSPQGVALFLSRFSMWTGVATWESQDCPNRAGLPHKTRHSVTCTRKHQMRQLTCTESSADRCYSNQNIMLHTPRRCRTQHRSSQNTTCGVTSNAHSQNRNSRDGNRQCCKLCNCASAGYSDGACCRDR